MHLHLLLVYIINLLADFVLCLFNITAIMRKIGWLNVASSRAMSRFACERATARTQTVVGSITTTMVSVSSPQASLTHSQQSYPRCGHAQTARSCIPSCWPRQKQGNRTKDSIGRRHASRARRTRTKVGNFYTKTPK